MPDLGSHRVPGFPVQIRRQLMPRLTRHEVKASTGTEEDRGSGKPWECEVHGRPPEVHISPYTRDQLERGRVPATAEQSTERGASTSTPYTELLCMLY